jgi:hypothetical protein
MNNLGGQALIEEEQRCEQFPPRRDANQEERARHPIKIHKCYLFHKWF